MDKIETLLRQWKVGQRMKDYDEGVTDALVSVAEALESDLTRNGLSREECLQYAAALRAGRCRFE